MWLWEKRADEFIMTQNIRVRNMKMTYLQWCVYCLNKTLCFDNIFRGRRKGLSTDNFTLHFHSASSLEFYGEHYFSNFFLTSVLF